MRLLAIFLVALFSATTFAQNIVTIESTVTGSQERPKIISIVPWQKPVDPDYYGDDIEGLGTGDDVFKPLDRDAFLREMKYIGAIRSNASGK